MGTVTVDGTNNIPVYGDLGSARTYNLGLMGPIGTLWRAQVDNEASRALLGARMLLDRQPWLGKANNLNADGLAWPRDNVILDDGTTVAANTVPLDVQQAEYELAALLVSNPQLYSHAEGESVSSLRMKDMAVTYARQQQGSFGERLPLPEQIMDRIGKYLGTINVNSGKVTGTTQLDGSPTESSFEDTDSQGNPVTYDRNAAF